MLIPFTRRSTAAVVALSLAAGTPLALSAQSGVGFTLRSSTLDDGVPSNPSATRVRVRGPVMRFDGIADGKQSKNEFGDGAYTLLDAGNRRIQIVMPGQKQYIEMKFDDSTAMAIKTAASVSSAVADLKVSGQALGGGGSVNGMPTNHYRLTTDFSEVTAGTKEKPRRMHVVEEYWVSDALRDVVDPIEQLGRTLGGKGGYVKSPYAGIGGSSVNELLSRRMAEQQRMFKGFPVKTVTTSEETLPDGKVQKSVTTTELSDVQRGNFDAALFTVPDGYAKFDPKAMMTNIGAQFRDAMKGAGHDKMSVTKDGADTTSVGDAAKDAAKEAGKDAAKDAAKDAIKEKLGGFLRRKKP